MVTLLNSQACGYRKIEDPGYLTLPAPTILIESHGASIFHQGNVGNIFFFDSVAFEAWYFYGRKKLNMFCAM